MSAYPGGQWVYLYSLGSLRYPFFGNLGLAINSEINVLDVTLSMFASLKIDNHLEDHRLYLTYLLFVLNLARVAPSFGYYFRCSITQVSCA